MWQELRILFAATILLQFRANSQIRVDSVQKNGNKKQISNKKEALFNEFAEVYRYVTRRKFKRIAA